MRSIIEIVEILSRASTITFPVVRLALLLPFVSFYVLVPTHKQSLFSTRTRGNMAAPRMSWPLTRVNMDNAYEASGYYRDEKRQVDVEVHDVPVSPVQSKGDAAQVVGSSDIFDENGNIRLIPVRIAHLPDRPVLV